MAEQTASAGPSADRSDPLIVADRLTKHFGPAPAAVEDVSFDVGPGEVVGLLGANGAGKTTVIRILLGLLAPTSGAAALLGAPPNQDNRAMLGYVPQGLGLYSELTAAENAAFMASAYGCPPADLTGPLGAVADRLVGRIPLGLQRQLAFVCALQHSPRALILDEPTSGVEPLARAHLWDTIREQADSGVGVLVTTHYMQEARQCDRLLLLSRGRLVGSGSEADIVADTTTLAVTASSWAEAFTALDAAGFAVTLAGTAVRVVDADPQRVQDALRDADVAGSVERVPATIDERMLVLARGSESPARD